MASASLQTLRPAGAAPGSRGDAIVFVVKCFPAIGHHVAGRRK